MELRLYRTWHWENVSDRIGGRPELVLRHRDGAAADKIDPDMRAECHSGRDA